MTEQELAEIEARAKAASDAAIAVWDYVGPHHVMVDSVTSTAYPADDKQAEVIAEFLGEASDITRALIAEVRRLRALVKDAEWVAYDYPDHLCPWCVAAQRDGVHEYDCPAFPQNSTESETPP